MIGGRRLLVAALTVVTAMALAGCGRGQPAQPAQPAQRGPAVHFEEPGHHAAVSSPVTVRMAAEGITVEPAGAVREGAGHFHIMIDTPCVAPGQVVPEDEQHKHYGKAQTEAVLELPPGQHTLCLQMANGAHEALPITETMTITVE